MGLRQKIRNYIQDFSDKIGKEKHPPEYEGEHCEEICCPVCGHDHSLGKLEEGDKDVEMFINGLLKIIF